MSKEFEGIASSDLQWHDPAFSDAGIFNPEDHSGI
jgi:hypothetical protein